jgi:cyclase
MRMPASHLRSIGLSCLLVASLVWSSPAVLAQPDLEQVQIQTIHVRDNIHMLLGSGGNIGVCVGDDGALMIDCQFAPLAEKIKAAVGELTDQPIRFLINTHYHFDHTDGNEEFGKAGVAIVAHQNVRRRLSQEQFIEALNMRFEPSPPAALPVITFSQDITFHWNGEDIRIIHVPPAHTDGDAIIHFTKANVIHTGDIYFNGMYPFIDTSAGGNIRGMIEAVDRILRISNDQTRFIPGHGPLSGIEELREYRRVLALANDRIGEMKRAGRTREEVVAAKPMRDHDETWGRGFMQPDHWVGIVYDSIR